jgi:hypothetical protein
MTIANVLSAGQDARLYGRPEAHRHRVGAPPLSCALKLAASKLMFGNHAEVVVSHAHSSQGTFDEGFTRIYIGRIAGGHRHHRNSCRDGFVRARSRQGLGAGDYLPE